MLPSEIPPCAAAMGCLCAGHARGDPASAECNTDERPAPRRAAMLWKKEANGQRSVQLKIMLTEPERVRLAASAQAQGETVSVFVRRAVREQMRRDALTRAREPDGS